MTAAARRIAAGGVALAAARRIAAGGVALAAALLALPALGLVIDASNPEVQEAPPPRDPGWANVGRRGSTSAVYLGDGWVVTARHSGLGPVLLDGASHAPVPGTDRVVHDPQTRQPTDLRLFRVEPAPDLPSLPIAKKRPPFGARILYVAWGQGRGEPTRVGDLEGFTWRPGLVKRWGTNRVFAVNVDVVAPNSVTRCFQSDFSRHGTRTEAQGATGDSGGAAFIRHRGRWKLAGILLSIAKAADQEPGVSLYGNITNSADLAYYRGTLLALMAEVESEAPPDPSPG